MSVSSGDLSMLIVCQDLVVSVHEISASTLKMEVKLTLRYLKYHILIWHPA